MAIAVKPEKESSTLSSLDQPYWVSDDALAPGVKIDREDAIAAAAAQAAIDFGAAGDDYSFERLTHKTARVTILYRDYQLQPLTPIGGSGAPTVEYGFNGIQFTPQQRKFSLGNVGAWSIADPMETPPDWKGLVNVTEVAGELICQGYQLALPPETDYANFVIPNGSFTAEYRAVVESLLFKVHGGPGTFEGRDIGEVMLVRAQARRQTDESLFLSFGFSKKDNGPRTVGDFTTPDDVEGHDLVWVQSSEKESGTVPPFPILVPQYVYAERIWPYGDLNLLDLP